jgi:hypothetical protein
MVAMVSINEWLANPTLAWSFAAYIDPDYWYPSYGGVMNFQRSTEADFEVDSQYFGVFTHDWRVEPLLDWLVGLSDRALVNGFEPLTETIPVSPLIVLSESEFADAVRQALRFHPP